MLGKSGKQRVLTVRIVKLVPRPLSERHGSLRDQDGGGYRFGD